MHKIAVSIVIFLSLNILLIKISDAMALKNKKSVSVAFFIDDHNERFGAKKCSAITSEFVRTISKKASSIIIVSNYILKNMILRKYTKNQDPFFYSLAIDLTDWDIYSINETQFFVFVLRDCDNSILNQAFWQKINLSEGGEYNGRGDEKFPIIPWEEGIPAEAKRLLFHENLQYITYAKDKNTAIKDLSTQEKNIHKKFDVAQLPLIFKSSENNKNLSSCQPCNILINGHGGYLPGVKFLGMIVSPERGLVAGMSAEDFASLLLFFNDKLNTKSLRLLSCYAGGQFLDLIRIKNCVPIRIKYLFIVDSITDAPSYDIFPSKPSSYEGLDIKGYFDALENFQNNIESFEAAIKTIKSDIAEPFKGIRSKIKELERSSGLNGVLQKLSLPSNWYVMPSGLNNAPQILIPEIGWFITFNTVPFVQKIIDANLFKALASPEIFEDDEVKIGDTREEPLLIKKVTIKSRLKKMKFATAAEIEVSKALALLIYSEIIPITLNIAPGLRLNSETLYIGDIRRWILNLYKYFPSISCAEAIYMTNPVKKNFFIYPQFVSMQRSEGLNLFAKVKILNPNEPTIETGILNYIRDSFLVLRNRRSEKVFFIKELEGFNDFSQILDDSDEFKKFLRKKKLEDAQITLQNVFVKTSVVNQITNISISFNFHSKSWYLLYTAKDLNLAKAIMSVDKSQSLWRFKENESIHKKNLMLLSLAYLAQLNLQEYCEQLPVIRDLFHYFSTNIKIKDPSSTLSFREFFVGLDPKILQNAIKQSSDITTGEWMSFEKQENQLKLFEKLKKRTQLELNLEQKVRIQLKLKQIKVLFGTLKKKLEMLSSKLQLLKKNLLGIA